MYNQITFNPPVCHMVFLQSYEILWGNLFLNCLTLPLWHQFQNTLSSYRVQLGGELLQTALWVERPTEEFKNDEKEDQEKKASDLGFGGEYHGDLPWF